MALTLDGPTPLASASSRADALEQPGGQRLVAEDRAGLHRVDRVPADRPVRGAQLDPGQLGGPRRERLQPELEARGDRAPDVGAVRRRRSRASWPSRGPHHGGRAVQPGRGERIDQAIGADLVGSVDPDGERDAARALATTSGTLPAVGDRLDRGGQRRARPRPAQIASTSREGDPVELQEPARRGARTRRASPAGSVRARRVPRSAPARNRPSVTFVLPMSSARSMAPIIRGGDPARIGVVERRSGVRYHPPDRPPSVP